MVDRPNQFNGYPTMMNNFGGGMNPIQQQMQMQQLAQQQQQNALNQNRGIPGALNTENQQMWQQLQHQHRSQMGGMEMGNQGIAQLAGMNGMNGSNPFMNRMQGQQSMQQFSNLMNVRQQQTASRPILQQQQQQQGFGNVISQQGAQHFSQLNNPAMLNSLAPGLSRQFVRLGQAQQQRPQNGPLDPSAFPQQTPQVNGHLGVNQNVVTADGPSTPRMPPQFHEQIAGFILDKEGQRLSTEALKMKLTLFCRETENDQVKLETIRNNPNANSIEVASITNRINNRNRFAQEIRQRISSEVSGTPIPANELLTPNQQQLSGQRGQTPQQGWSTPNMQFNTSLVAQSNPGAMSRSVSTPGSQPNNHSSFANMPVNGSPHATVQQGVAPNHGIMQQIMSGRNIHPIDKEKFNDSLPQYLLRMGKNLDEQVLGLPSGHKFDLHLLHTLVINQGGGPAVKSNDLWPIIAAKLGFPASDSRSPPQFADRVRQIYDEYLQDFEKHYTMMVLNKLVQTNTLPTNLGNSQQAQAQGPPHGGPAPGVATGQILRNPLLHLAQQNLTLEVMRSKGIPDHIIQQVGQLRRAMLSSGLPSSLQPGSRTPGASQLPSASESFSINNAMQSAQNGQLLHQVANMPIGPQNPMIQQIPLSAQGQTLSQGIPKTTPERLQIASQQVKRMRELACEDRNKKPMPLKIVPDSEKAQFAQAFETLLKQSADMINFLPSYFAVVGDEHTTKTMVQVVDMAMRQRQHLSSPTPEYILDMNMLRRLQQMINTFKSTMSSAFQNAEKNRLAMQGNPPSQLHHAQQNTSSPQVFMPPNAPQPMPAIPSTPDSHHNRSTPPMPSATLASKMKPQVNSITSGQQTQIAPSPAASAPTPSQSAASPSNHTSPQTPKSPKSRTTAKKPAAKPSGRRSSKANPPSTPIVEQAATPGSSAPTPATMASTPDNREGSLKRQREPESSSDHAPLNDQLPSSNDDGPMAKRRKGEWENTPEASVLDHEEEAASIKTTEQAVEFFSHMTELMQMVGGSEGQTMPADVSNVLSQVLKSAGSFQGFTDTSVANEPLAGSSSKSPKLSTQEEFTEYFDYSYFKDEETPEMTVNSSTSTGASPESNPTEPGLHAPPNSSKSTESKGSSFTPDSFDPSHLGFLGEIDGGEAEYFTSRDGWRWDEIPTSSQDAQWAISS